jgi:hypothetical protein
MGRVAGWSVASLPLLTSTMIAFTRPVSFTRDALGKFQNLPKVAITLVRDLHDRASVLSASSPRPLHLGVPARSSMHPISMIIPAVV